MGSEHYCLRWNNHQSNLLGVFSQLLQEESLVDVTLACSEGASIRAHKVVLSACSSYFQSLFKDHPARHPIVILKDVRFSELRTLVEFMYKGEVNVQYCQLSALLKTAESLKVKGLAEMTNQSTTQNESERERERDQDRIRPHSTPKSDDVSPAKSRGDSDRCSPSPTRLQSSSSTSPPLALYQRKNNRDHHTSGDHHHHQPQLHQQQQQQPHHHHHQQQPPQQQQQQQQQPQSQSQQQQQQHHQQQQQPQEQQQQSLKLHAALHHPHHLATSASTSITNIDEDDEDDDDEDDEEQMKLEARSCSPDDDASMSNDVGINMTMNSNSATSNIPPSTIVAPPINSSTSSVSSLAAGDHRPSSRGMSGMTPSSSFVPSSSGISSPIMAEPIAGPSGLAPVQSVPLSLKKEMDWDRCDEKSTGESSSDYRHPHESEATEPPHSISSVASGIVGGGCSIGGVIGSTSGVGGGGTQSGGSLAIGSIQCSSSNEGGVGGGGNGVGGLQQSQNSLIQTPTTLHDPPLTCVYCYATFPHQSKLTRHILSHSLETLKYRENPTPHMLHPGHHHLANLIPSDLPPQQHFVHRQAPPMEPLEPPDGSSVAMEIDFASAAAAAAAAAVANASGNSTGGCMDGSGLAGLGSGIIGQSEQGNVVLCKFCGKSFPDVSSLIVHLPVHTGDRPFKCEFCGKAFKLRHHMKDHCRVHTGERPFRCSMCGKTFSRSTILKAHEKTHFPKYVRKFLSPSPVDTKDDSPQ